MAIERFKSVEDMPDIARVEDPEARLRRIDELWKASQLFSGGTVAPRGVQRFESISDANAARERMQAERMRKRRNS